MLGLAAASFVDLYPTFREYFSSLVREEAKQTETPGSA